MKIMILNLPRQVNEDELAALFTPYGKVASCIIVMGKETNMSKGFGFVEMKDEVCAQTSIKALHGTNVGNQRIRVKMTENKV